MKPENFVSAAQNGLVSGAANAAASATWQGEDFKTCKSQEETGTSSKVVIYGPEGIGKSTFVAEFPNPVFIDTEGSTDNMDVARLDKPTS